MLFIRHSCIQQLICNDERREVAGGLELEGLRDGLDDVVAHQRRAVAVGIRGRELPVGDVRRRREIRIVVVLILILLLNLFRTSITTVVVVVVWCRRSSK